MMLDKILQTMPVYNLFEYWFRPIAEVPNAWGIVDVNEPTVEIGILDEGVQPNNRVRVRLPEGSEDDVAGIELQFGLFKQRPEYFTTKPVTGINALDQEALVEAYEVRILGLIFQRIASAGKDPDQNLKSAMACIEWLRSTDLYNAPGSTQYHDNEPCGLIKHSLRVFNHILRLRYDEAFNEVSVHSAGLVALTHDWCKIGLYEMYMRNVKNEDTGKWEQVPSYRRNQKGIPLGHGVSSMFIASKFFKLSPEEAVALRWHMGEYNVADNEQNELHLANESYPLVFLIQFADRLSITKYAN